MTSELEQAVESLGRTLAERPEQIIHVSIPGPDKAWVRDRFEPTLDPRPRQHSRWCRPRREGDEWACNCGRRWGADEPDPHGR